MDRSAYPIRIPLLNPNEPEAKVVSLVVQEGEFVEEDSVLCTLETTKSTADVLAEVSGYVTALRIFENDLVQAGTLLCYLAESQDWQPPSQELQDRREVGDSQVSSAEIPTGLRISQPALRLAEEIGLDLAFLPVGPLVTEKMVRELGKKESLLHLPEKEYDPHEVIVYGGGGHGKSLIDLIRSKEMYHIHGIIDDGLIQGEQVLDIPVLGGSGVLPGLYQQGIRQAVNAVGGIGDISTRIKVFNLISENRFTCPTVIHPSAEVEPSSKVSEGVQIFSQAYVGSDAQLGFGVIINTGAVVSHDCMIGDYVNISPGALLAGGVEIGRGSLVGMGVTINLGVVIGSNARIGNGATIKADVPDDGMVKAGTIWPG